MRAYSDMTTKRLEALAHRMGVECQIRTMEAQEDGRYFVFAVDEIPLKRPVPLGFTVDRAAYAINAGTWERYAMRGDPVRLDQCNAARKPSKGKAPRRRRCVSW